jgi:hypothetical protein
MMIQYLNNAVRATNLSDFINTGLTPLYVGQYDHTEKTVKNQKLRILSLRYVLMKESSAYALTSDTNMLA